MSATTFISWRLIYLAGCVLQGAVLMEIQTSRACYGTVGLPCTKHSIRCNPTQKIAIVDAYFTFNRECGAGITNCQAVNPDNVTVSRRSHSIGNTDLISLYNNCSTENQCGHQAPRHTATVTFSIVRYQCIDEDVIIPMTEASQRNASETTIIYKHTDEMPKSKHICTIQSQMPVNITALDVRLGDGNEPERCSILTITTTPYTCSDVIWTYKQLQTIQSPGQSFITLRVPEGSRSVVWLGIASTRSVFINCYAKVSTRRTVTAQILASSSVTVGTRTDSTSTTGEVTTFPNKDRLPVSSPSRFPAGVFMGGVAAGAVIAILVGLAVYVLVIRRRYDLTAKKQGDTPASVEHPTYAGLLAGADVNNYAVIEQTSRSQEDTTHGPTATPDYQTI
ncbi:uncharacterized protein LOC124265728 [Haliotis rubra]|uniref:uncharacterized protein LOC124265728 n=1 Tax=Haliotis rubra TaxID=36100 RepID=UPI001EE504DB|nr:uncharacterized protein LOC124265728 [Haliotis rubra]